MTVEGKKKSFAERAPTSSRVRTGKKGRKTPRRKVLREFSPAVRTKPTTGHVTYDKPADLS